jgi:hypothetical protein
MHMHALSDMAARKPQMVCMSQPASCAKSEGRAQAKLVAELIPRGRLRDVAVLTL